MHILKVQTFNMALVHNVRQYKGAMIKLFLCGDVMTGRGIDQVLPHPGNPRIFESYLRDAREYARLAIEANGPVPAPVDFSYIWGDSLDELKGEAPDLRLINLETAITRSDDCWDKGINYRMHPENIHILTAAGVDCCALANNHVLDWGYQGLAETIETLKKVGIKSSGAGSNRSEAEKPAVIEVKAKGRVIFFSFGTPTSGIPHGWAAAKESPGVSLLLDLSEKSVKHIGDIVRKVKREGDIVILSIHWGGNWGYDIPESHSTFARNLIDNAEVDLVHGHSSHHAKGIEVYDEKLILYGCGDFLNDYEGIRGYEEFRDDLAILYFAGLDRRTGNLLQLSMTPMQIKNFRLNRVSRQDALWLEKIFNREGKKLKTKVSLNEDNTLTLHW